MTGFLLQLRRGPGVWMAPVLLLAGLLYARTAMFTTTLWGHTSGAIAGSPMLMAPIAAGVAAYAGGRPHRRRFAHVDRLAARGVGAAAVEMAAIGLWVVVAYAVLASGLFTLTATQATWGHPEWLWVATAGAGLVVTVPIGWMIGRLIPLRFTPFVVAVAIFALNVTVDGVVDQWWRRLFPAVVWYMTPFDEVVTRQLWGQLAWYGGLASAVFAALALVTRRRWRDTLVLSLISVLGGAAGLWLVATSGFLFNDASDRTVVWVCEGQSAEVCIHPAYADSIPELRPRLEAVMERLAQTPFAVRRAEQRPLGGPAGAPSAGAVPFSFQLPTVAHAEDAAYELATNALGIGPACYPRGRPPLAGPGVLFVLVDWATERELPFYPPDQEAARNWLDSQPVPVVERWVSANAGKIRSCTLTLQDFG